MQCMVDMQDFDIQVAEQLSSVVGRITARVLMLLRKGCAGSGKW